MSEISLVVTKGVSERCHLVNQRQIAYRDPSDDIRSDLEKADGANRLTLTLGGFVRLQVGDTGAIWRSHNPNREAIFDALFDLLNQRPDIPMRFVCELVRPGVQSQTPLPPLPRLPRNRR